MRYQLIGVNHKSAPLELRERLAIPESQAWRIHAAISLRTLESKRA